MSDDDGGDRQLEAELVGRAREGDREAFGALVERHMRRAYRVALGLTGSREAALDLAQDAFVRVLRAHADLDPGRPFYPFLHTTLARLCFNHLRDRRRRAEHLSQAAPAVAPPPPPDPAGDAAAAEERRRCRAAVADLPDREREVLVLKEYEGLKYREIADALDVPIGTVMSRLYSARRRLAQALEERS